MKRPADLAMRYRRDAARLDSMMTLQASLPEIERSVWHCGTEATNRMVRLPIRLPSLLHLGNPRTAARERQPPKGHTVTPRITNA